MNISAKDKDTGKENKITIKANSGLSESEIKQMIKDAEEHAEEDKKAIELINARNMAEGTYNGFKKDFDDYKDQVTEEERTKAEEALNALQEAIKGEDPEALTKATTDLYQAIGPITAKKSEAEEAIKKDEEEKATQVDETATETKAEEKDPNVVDVEFTEKPTKD
jgi:molecular chaperone DnaK